MKQVHLVGSQPDCGRLFPGHRAGASLKLSLVLLTLALLHLFPGHRAGASLKRP